jgi:carboxypeptidase C (cathepsin A)
MTHDGDFTPPPYSFEENKHTWLEFTDLVFIDPVGTGFSGHPDDEDPKQFYGIDEDVKSVGEFIRLYITKHKRWLSPKFIAGESYGATRAAGLSGYLQDEVQMDMNGIILVSGVIDFATTRPLPGNDLPYALWVPSYTATAWYHKKLPPHLMENLEKTLKEVEKWVLDEYIPALAHGDSLPAERFNKIADKLAEYTGLSRAFIERCQLRISNQRFMKELLRDEYRTVGRLDTRFKGIDSDNAGEQPQYDVSLLVGAFVPAVNDYIRRELQYENDLPYAILNETLSKEWNWKNFRDMGYPSVADTLREQIHKNQFLKVLVICGYFDVGTPYFAMKYTINHMRLAPCLRDNISFAYFNAGHMVYYPYDMLAKFTNDVKEFVEKQATKIN